MPNKPITVLGLLTAGWHQARPDGRSVVLPSRTGCAHDLSRSHRSTGDDARKKVNPTRRRGTTGRRFVAAMLAVGVLATARTPATAQTLPWDVFPDDDAFGNRISASNCGLINAENAELVVESASGRLIIVSSADVALDDSTVDFDRFVFFQDLPFGMISFAEDADGFRTLWWVTLNGLVIHVDPLTGEPSVSNSLPSDFSNVPCNACPFWDDPTVCDEPAAPPPIDEPVTITLCGVTTPLTLALMVAGLMMMGLVRRRAV